MTDVKIKVLLLPVGKPGTVVEIDNKLEAMQKLVGGSIEGVSIEANVMVMCNDEGRLNGLPFNRLFADLRNPVDFCGDIFITRHDNEGESTSLTARDIKRFAKRYGPPQRLGIP
jgi:hypothetical protein